MPEEPASRLEAQHIEEITRVVLRVVEQVARPKEKKTRFARVLEAIDQRWKFVLAGLTIATALLARVLFGVSLLQPIEELAIKQAAARAEQQKDRFNAWARDFHLELGRKLLDVGQVPAAKAEFELALAADPTSVDAARGKFKAELFGSLRDNRWDPEVSHIQTAQLLAEHPDDPHARYLRGLVLEGAHPDDALALFGQALEKDPGLVVAHFEMGIVYDRLGKHEESVAEYRKAIALSNWSAGARNNLGYELYELGRYDEALAVYDGLRGLVPTIGAPLVVITNIDWAKGDFAGARQNSELLVRLLEDKGASQQPWNSSTWFINMGSGIVYMTTLPGKLRYAHHQLALSLFALGRDDEAIAAIRAAPRADEENAIANLARWDATTVTARQPGTRARMETYAKALGQSLRDGSSPAGEDGKLVRGAASGAASEIAAKWR